MLRYFFITIFFCFSASVIAEEEFDKGKLSELTLYIPGSEGGGYHHTAMALKHIFEHELDVTLNLKHVPGAGGVLALSQFTSIEESKNNAILLGGRSMIGAAIYNNANISVLDTLPLLRISGKPLAVAVAAGSPIESIHQLIDVVETEASGLKWLGGSAGAVDYLFLQELYSALGQPNKIINFFPVPGGGTAVAQQLVEGGYVAAVSTYDEFKKFANQGKVKILAVTSGITIQPDIVHLKDTRLELEYLDWHGIFLSKNVEDTAKSKITKLFRQVTLSSQWQKVLKENGWQENYLPADEFFQFVQSENTNIERQMLELKQNVGSSSETNENIKTVLKRPYRLSLIVGSICVLLVLSILVLRHYGKKRETHLYNSLQKAEQEKEAAQQELEKKLNSVANHIEQEFEKWELTKAEKEVGLLLLKGYTFKGIAELRNKSERTVRQQAGAIYAKSNLASRNDLSAYFLEDLM